MNNLFNHRKRQNSNRLFVLPPPFVVKQLGLLILIFSLILFESCRKEQKSINKQEKILPQNTTGDGNEELMEFATQTDNPYTIENMEAALSELQASHSLDCGDINFNVRITHKYIRFEPTDSSHQELLTDDTTLILFDYPLDRKITKGGTYYRDPSLSASQLNYQWCCVPANKTMPIGVPYTLLSNLYLPEEDPELEVYYETQEDACITKLIEQALDRTGNFDTSFYDNSTTSFSLKPPPKWTPKGNIRMFDDFSNTNVNLRGVKVKAHRWFETRECLTDNNGNFNILHQFRYPVDYSIKWERNDFEIRHKNTGQAYFNGPHQKGDWNLTINSNYSRMFAIIHRAAHRYYYEFKENLKSPPLNSQMVGRITLGAYMWNVNIGNTSADCAMWGRLILNEIRIFKSNDDCITLFSTTIHELAHASHWNLGSHSEYNQADIEVGESWATGVEWRLTKLEYPDYYGVFRSTPTDYTNVVMDCMDNESNQSSNYGKTYNQGDSVSGYSIKQLEDALKGKKTWNGWKQSIKDKHNNATENKLDALFNLWH